MAGQVQPDEPGAQRSGRGLMPPEVVDLIVPPLRFGVLSGAAGAFTGVGAAILRDANLATSGIMTGTQWAVLGTTYWFSRQMAVRALGHRREMTPSNKVKASAIASVPTGAMMGLSVGRTRSLGSSIAFCGVVAIGGQLVVNHWASRQGQPKEESNGDGWLSARWSPLQKLSDEEYIRVMDEKILRFDADIALIDDRIAQLRADQAMAEAEKETGAKS